MTTVIDYALLAGASYYDTRSDINRIPVPSNWSLYSRVPQDSSTGFEASAYTNGTEIVISFAGTDPGDITGDIAADLGLAAGTGSAQLLQAAQYYLQVKASAPAGTTITLTGHSLGGGLASLVAAFFGEKAYTFDQAPFLQSARMFTTTDVNGNTILAPSVVQSLRDSLAAGGTPVDMLAKLDAYIAANNPLNSRPIEADTLAARGSQIVNFNTEGEFLTSWPVIPTSNRIGAQIDIRNYNAGVSGIDLHSQTLLTAFLQSNQSAVTSASGQVQSLSEVTYKLQDLLKMIFDTNLFSYTTSIKNAEDENFLERLVKHQAGIGTTLPADAMVTRFTSDLWKLAQDGGLTLNDGNATNSQLHELSNTLIAFAMQKYYEETAASAGYRKELFTDLATAGEGAGGIRFDMADVSTKFATAFANKAELTLTNAKGYEQYFKYYLQQSTYTDEERNAITAMLPMLRDWYVQAGSSGMVATDTLSRGAFMLGGAGADTLAGGDKADLLVGNGGDDVFKGGQGNDVLLGGQGTDTYVFERGDGLDTILDSDGQGQAMNNTNYRNFIERIAA